MSLIEVKSKIDIEELIRELRQLDQSTLDYIVTSLQKEQAVRIPKKMETAQFWALIDKIDFTSSNDPAKLKPLVKALTQLSISEILQFAERLADLLSQLDGPDFIKPLKAEASGYSADTFLYARCFAIAQGQEFYESVLSKTAPLPTKYFEVLLTAPSQAYEQKTGEKYSYVPSINYESFFNQNLWGEAAIVL